MRECWVNVSVVHFREGPKAVLGVQWAARDMAVEAQAYAQYRLHVRLKPEPQAQWHADRLAAQLARR
jgi:hypothetical protein